jgi:hypothetical protein
MPRFELLSPANPGTAYDRRTRTRKKRAINQDSNLALYEMPRAERNQAFPGIIG